MIESWLASRRSILVVPALSVTGLFSAIITHLFWSWFFMTGSHYEPPSATLQSTMFGLGVSAVLWGFGYIRRWTQVIGILTAAVGTHAIERFLDPHLPQRAYLCWDCTSIAFLTWEVAIRFFLVASILFAVTLWLSEYRPHTRVLLFVSISASVIGSVALGIMDAWELKVRGFLIFNGEPLGLIWQPTLAGILGITLWATSPSDRRTATADPSLRSG